MADHDRASSEGGRPERRVRPLLAAAVTAAGALGVGAVLGSPLVLAATAIEYGLIAALIPAL